MTPAEVGRSTSAQPDLHPLKPLGHKGIFFDELKVKQVLANRKMFQGPPEELELGGPNTNCYSYKRFLWGKRMMVASNTWMEEMCAASEADREWTTSNSVLLDVGSEKMWIE